MLTVSSNTGAQSRRDEKLRENLHVAREDKDRDGTRTRMGQGWDRNRTGMRQG